MNDTLIFLVLGGLALIFKWLTRQASDDSKKPEPPSPNEQAPPLRQPQSDEERVRRFLEALGAPPGTRPPPPVRPRRVVKPAAAPPGQRPRTRRSWAQPLPPLVTTPEDLGLPPLPTTPFEPVVAEAAPPIPVAPSPPVSVPVAPPPLPGATALSRAMPRRSLGTLLRKRGSVRQAIILREILGPPRGLQALDELRSF
jgi:hypothetical protein